MNCEHDNIMNYCKHGLHWRACPTDECIQHQALHED